MHRYRPNQNPDLQSVVASAPFLGADLELVPEAKGASGLVVPRGQSVRLAASWADCPTEPACGNGYCEAGEGINVNESCPEDCTQPKGCRDPRAMSLSIWSRESPVNRRGSHAAFMAFERRHLRR